MRLKVRNRSTKGSRDFWNSFRIPSTSKLKTNADTKTILRLEKQIIAPSITMVKALLAR